MNDCGCRRDVKPGMLDVVFSCPAHWLESVVNSLKRERAHLVEGHDTTEFEADAWAWRTLLERTS